MTRSFRHGFAGSIPSNDTSRIGQPGKRALTDGFVPKLQMKAGGHGGTETVARAAQGVEGAGGALPFLDTLQSAFGSHDVSNVRAHTTPDAARAANDIGARAFAIGNDVAFAETPDLHTAAHEAAHVVQQRAGVHLKDHVGSAGDEYERHADAVADRVVRGENAEALLDAMSNANRGGRSPVGSMVGGGATTAAVQRDPATQPAPAAAETTKHTSRATFLKSAAIKFSPDGRTDRVIDAVFPFFCILDGVIAGYLTEEDQFWKVNWHIEAMLVRIDEAKRLVAEDWRGAGARPPDPTTFHAGLDGVKNTVAQVKSPVNGFFYSTEVGQPSDVTTSPEALRHRYDVMISSKHALETIFTAMRPWEYVDAKGKSSTLQMTQLIGDDTPQGGFALAYANVKLPGTSEHGTGMALDIQAHKDDSDTPADHANKNSRIKASAKQAGAPAPYDEVNHVHCAFPNIK